MKNIRTNKAGSVWRRWDLHIHTPLTKLNDCYKGINKNEIWDNYIEKIKNSNVSAFGITDYFSCENYFYFVKKYQEKYPDSEKVFFCNIELRASESIGKDGDHPHIHVLFSNVISQVNQKKIEEFLYNLKTQNKIDMKHISCSELKQNDFRKATVSITSINDALKQTFEQETPYIIAFPAGNNGMRSTDNNRERSTSLADTFDTYANIFFGGVDNVNFFLRKDRYEGDNNSDPKPVVSGSDAHSFQDMERLSGNDPKFPPTWIKADLTFDGLKQICLEPKDRVFIGNSPEVLCRLERRSTKFIHSLVINPIEKYDNRNGIWFRNSAIKLNPELTAIIGNKGSGKSAIVDILGLLGNSHNEEDFSFLSKKPGEKRFCKDGLAENFQAKLTWEDGTEVTKILNEGCSREAPEKVRYLPQNYFEKITNEIETDSFQQELNNAVFHHIDVTERAGSTKFEQLEKSKKKTIDNEIRKLKNTLEEINSQIVELERERSPQNIKQIQEKINEKELEIKALKDVKPIKPKKEQSDDEAENSRLKILNEKRDNLNKIIHHLLLSKEDYNKKLENLISLKDDIGNLKSYIQSEIFKIEKRANEFEIDINKVLSFNVEMDIIDTLVSEIKQKLIIMEKDNGLEDNESSDIEKLNSLVDLNKAKNLIEGEISEERKKLSAVENEFQNYVDNIASWEKRKVELYGEEDNPGSDTLLGLKKKLCYIDNDIDAVLNERYEIRKETLSSIFSCKLSMFKFYNDLKKKIDQHIDNINIKGMKISIDTSVFLRTEFKEKFFYHIDQRKKGPFRSSQDGNIKIDKMIENTNWNCNKDVIKFCNTIVNEMKGEFNNDNGIEAQVKDINSFYNYLFALEYLDVKYNLKQDDKDLKELSPGERGLLLLIFYLGIDNNDVPLIIDQPEDNLDNSSIFEILAECIREAKKSRQVILVTHNPNLAIGADAEQIVYVEIDKKSKNTFTCKTGSVENAMIRNLLLDVLEGTFPAFSKRKLKYGV